MRTSHRTRTARTARAPHAPRTLTARSPHAPRTLTARAPHAHRIRPARAPQATSHIKTGAAAGMDAEDVLVGPLNSRVQFERVKVSQ